MNRIIQDYTSYNLWANTKISSFISKITEEMMDEPVKSSFPSLQKTIIHIWGAEDLWMSRLNGISPDGFHNANFSGTREELCKQWLETSSSFVDYASKQDMLSLEKIIQYKNVKGEQFHNKVYEIITHSMNHSTYHRGQLVTMLREVGFTDLSSTDLITYYRERS